ncbi:MAG TPA: UDP-N-acetylglucosamine--N-acetylmuramyl-(pentapeptide) pyrophosphoryl-undecaprenol N-acetylglucosamine transferase [Candidatus Limnocylindrales bacterium]|nr:UDP-N-acetylglucosamine--N-acetylmuramyl-(pentapeptide) pyrophosphoryl-undecaprenol N-acetylglucosamine transferase [Candidatus Limnocylindrales bacterium]
MRLLIAGGGTGGHIYPALAVARSLRDRPSAPDLVWLGGHRGLEADLVKEAGIRVRRLLLRSLRTVDLSAQAALDPIRLGLSVPQSAAILAAERPAAILTTGGYVAIPTLMAARALRIPVLLWEGNAIPGRAVRVTARLANALAVSYDAAGEALARAGRPTFVTGTPIRDVTAITRTDARARLGLPADPPTILIFGGSQAVRRFNAAVTAALPRLVERVQVVHVSGESGYAAALAQREQLPPDRRDRYRPYPFLRDDMLAALVATDLVVGRAGSSTLAEVTALGIPSVIVPYPHAAGHQGANAEILAAAGAARIVADEAFDADALLAASTILFDESARAEMAAAAHRFGRPGAADAIATLVLALAERRPLPDAATIEGIARGAAT